MVATMMSPTKCFVAAASLAVLVALFVRFVSIANDQIWAFVGFVISFPPSQFVSTLRGDNIVDIRAGATFAMLWGTLAASYSLHFMHTAGYLAGDSAKAWLELIRSASALYFLPHFLGCIRARTERGSERAATAPFVVTLPGGIVAGFEFLPGSLMDTVARSNECRAAAYYYCSYLIHCVCTLAPAAAAAWFGLIAVETSLVYVTVCSVVSIALCLPLFFLKKLNTPKYTSYVSWALVPVLIATFLLHTYGGVELKEIGSHADFMRNIVWIAMYPLAIAANLQ